MIPVSTITVILTGISTGTIGFEPMRNTVAMMICIAAGTFFAFAYLRGELSVHQALSFTSGAWLFTGWWLGHELGRLTEKDRYNTKDRKPLSQVPRTMVNGGIALGMLALLSLVI